MGTETTIGGPGPSPVAAARNEARRQMTSGYPLGERFTGASPERAADWTATLPNGIRSKPVVGGGPAAKLTRAGTDNGHSPSCSAEAKAGGGAAGGAAAPLDVAPATFAKVFSEDALKKLFSLKPEAPLATLYEQSTNNCARIAVADFAMLYAISYDRAQADHTPASKQRCKDLNTVANAYLSLIKREGMKEESALGAYYVGHESNYARG
ncbi:MAG: hypothetical protein JWP38_1640 [Herbaspirillum sp.]|nr:hypothetical protein [Herbaspirillum sp.]